MLPVCVVCLHISRAVADCCLHQPLVYDSYHTANPEDTKQTCIVTQFAVIKGFKLHPKREAVLPVVLQNKCKCK